MSVQELIARVNPMTKTCECVCGKVIMEGSIQSHVKSNTHIRAVTYNYDAEQQVYNCTCGKVIKKNSFASHLKSRVHSAAVEVLPLQIAPLNPLSHPVHGSEKMKEAMKMLEQAKQMMIQAQAMLCEALAEVHEDEAVLVSRALEPIDPPLPHAFEPRVIDAFNPDIDVGADDTPLSRLFEERDFSLDQLFDAGRRTYGDGRIEERWTEGEPRLGDIVRFTGNYHLASVLVGDGQLYRPTSDEEFTIDRDIADVLLAHGISPVISYLNRNNVSGRSVADSVYTTDQDAFFQRRGITFPTEAIVYWTDDSELVYTYDEDVEEEEHIVSFE